MSMTIKLSRKVMKQALSQIYPAEFSARTEIVIMKVIRPGDPAGFFPGMPPQVHQAWAFYTAFDHECTLVFDEADVAEVILHPYRCDNWLDSQGRWRTEPGGRLRGGGQDPDFHPDRRCSAQPEPCPECHDLFAAEQAKFAGSPFKVTIR